MTIHRIANPSEADQHTSRSILTAAFIQDPVMRWLYPQSERYLQSFPDFCGAFGGQAFAMGTAWTSEKGGGTALWLPPNEHVDGEAVQAVVLETVERERLPIVGGVLEEMAQYHPKEPCWYLALIGVDPAQRGQGLGGQLLETTLKLCDEDKMPAYLESSNPANISLYMRHGFAIMGEIQKNNSPVITPMLREARS